MANFCSWLASYVESSTRTVNPVNKEHPLVEWSKFVGNWMPQVLSSRIEFLCQSDTLPCTPAAILIVLSRVGYSMFAMFLCCVGSL